MKDMPKHTSKGYVFENWETLKASVYLGVFRKIFGQVPQLVLFIQFKFCLNYLINSQSTISKESLI